MLSFAVIAAKLFPARRGRDTRSDDAQPTGVTVLTTRELPLPPGRSRATSRAADPSEAAHLGTSNREAPRGVRDRRVAGLPGGESGPGTPPSARPRRGAGISDACARPDRSRRYSGTPPNGLRFATDRFGGRADVARAARPLLQPRETAGLAVGLFAFDREWASTWNAWRRSMPSAGRAFFSRRKPRDSRRSTGTRAWRGSTRCGRCGGLPEGPRRRPDAAARPARLPPDPSGAPLRNSVRRSATTRRAGNSDSPGSPVSPAATCIRRRSKGAATRICASRPADRSDTASDDPDSRGPVTTRSSGQRVSRSAIPAPRDSPVVASAAASLSGPGSRPTASSRAR